MKVLTLIADIDEYAPFKENIKSYLTEEFTFLGMPGLKFTYKTFDVTVLCFGIGKVHAAIGASAALMNKKYDLVLNTGWSGAVSGVSKGEIVVGTQFFECDYDMSAIGYAPGLKPYHKEAGIKCNNKYLQAVIDADMFPAKVFGCGDIFLTDKVLAGKFKELFNISTFDMESGALAEACVTFNVPFLSIRKISDDANDVAGADYRETLHGDETAFSEIITATLDILSKA